MSDDLTIRVATKIPVENILRLASLAYGTLRIPPSVGGADLIPTDSTTDWLAVMLVSEVRWLLRNRLRQDYVTVQDELPYIRGRLLFESTAEWSRPGMVACEFTDFLPDIPENRVLRTTLEVLTTHRLLPGIKQVAEQLLRGLQSVTYVAPTDQLLNSCHLTRLNRHYEPALRLCRLFLEQSGVELEPGRVSTPAFFFPMEYVFQEAIAAVVRERLPDASRQPSGSYSPTEGMRSRKISFAGDIGVGSPLSLVLDTKYANAEIRNQFGGLSYKNDYIYQIAFYALSFGCPGVLVYPKVDKEVDVEFDVEGVRIRLLSVDLQQKDLPGLDSFIVRLNELLAEKPVGPAPAAV